MRRNKLALTLWATIFLTATTPIEAVEIVVARFSSGELDGWEEKNFVGQTQYSIVTTDNKKRLKAETQSSASGLFKEIKVDLEKTPYLHWSWRVDNIYRDNDETSKEGDDYPARIYLIVSGGLIFWRTQTINYVWSSHKKTESSWLSPYTDNATLIAVRSGDQELKKWHNESRNVLKDLQHNIDAGIVHIDGVALMSDSDNTGQSAIAYYGDIYFSDKP